MIDVKTNPIALIILDELNSELISKDKSYVRAVDEIILATQESLKNELKTNLANVEIDFSEEPFRGTFKELLRVIVEAEKLESEYKRTTKRKKLCVEKLRLEVEEMFDLNTVRISHSLGAVVKLTKEEIKHKKEAHKEQNQAIVDSVKMLLDISDAELKAFCDGETLDKLKGLRDDQLEAFFVDMAEFLAKNGHEGHRLVAGVFEDGEILEKVLASDRTPKPVQFYAEIVQELKNAA
jgi:hypothetical protein